MVYSLYCIVLYFIVLCIILYDIVLCIVRLTESIVNINYIILCVLQIIKPWPSGTIWRRVEALYKNKFQRELPSNTLELVLRMESVMVEE